MLLRHARHHRLGLTRLLIDVHFMIVRIAGKRAMAIDRIIHALIWLSALAKVILTALLSLHLLNYPFHELT